jgi:hypothetical protein
MKDGTQTWEKRALGTPACVIHALTKLGLRAKYVGSRRCKEPLYQAVPKPLRYALAKYLTRHYRRVLDFFILDEAHEAANADSAQSQAAHRLIGTGVPTVLLTGSIMNGYARSLGANQHAIDPRFREEFPFPVAHNADRDDRRSRSWQPDFVRMYGYLKKVRQETDPTEGKVIAWGSQSDARRTVREKGHAPGVLPLFLLRYLLRLSVTLHMTDLALELPAHREIVERVEPTPEQFRAYATLLSTVKAQIKKDRFKPGLSGKLFGAMGQVPTILDRGTVDCGNTPDGAFVAAYPNNPQLGPDAGRVIVRCEGLPASTILPKERRMLDIVKAELAEGRNVMVFGWHAGENDVPKGRGRGKEKPPPPCGSVLARLRRLLEAELGEPVALLLSKVKADTRQDWIDANVVAKGVRVMVVNPACVETGLNNLVHFQTVVWMENPACDPQTMRQANGRVHRIGKRAETRSYFLVYADTLQEAAHRLLMHKVAVGMAADGLDAEDALAAAGVGESDVMDAFSVGRALWAASGGELEAA